MAYNRSTFPESYDVFRTVYDLPPTLKTKASRYQTLKLKETLTVDEQTELNQLTIELQDYIISPELFNHFSDAVTGIQKHYVENTSTYVEDLKTETRNYVDTKKAEMQANIDKFDDKGNYNSTTTYMKNNFVRYDYQTYICLVDNLINITPTDDGVNWRLMAARGEQGERGLSGLNLVYTGTYNPIVQYNTSEAVEYGGSIYYATQKSIGETPTSNGTSWTIFMPRASILVSAIAPNSPTDKQVWIDTSTGRFKWYDLSTTTWKEVNKTDIDNIRNDIGDLTLLETTNNTSIVNSVNEINTKVINVNDEISRLQKINSTQDRELAYLKLKQEASDRIEGGNLFANDMNGNSFGMTFKNVRTKSTEPLNVGETLLSQGAISKIGKIENGQFEVGDEVIVLDDVNQEAVTITISEIVQEIATNTVTDATVVNSAFTTSASARPVMLDNGWIITSAYDLTNSQIKFFVSKDNFATSPTQLCYISQASTAYWSVVNKGNTVYVITTSSGGTVVNYFKIDATTQTNVALTPTSSIDSGQTAFNGISLDISPDKTTLWSTESSKNPTYPDSFNIRACNGTIQADGSVTWGAVEQVTEVNDSTLNYYTPSITFNVDEPIIVAEQRYTGSLTGAGREKFIIAVFGRDLIGDGYTYDKEPWNGRVIYKDAIYSQSNPQVVSDKNGVLLCVWHGLDATHTSSHNIRFSKSTDGGVTWSSMEKLTSSTSSQFYPTITVDKNNSIYILWQGLDSTISATYNQLRKIVHNGTSWSSITTITNNTTGTVSYPSSLYDNSFSLVFSEPLVIYLDNQVNNVKFRGTWSTLKEQFYLECSPLINSYKTGALIGQSTINDDGTFHNFNDITPTAKSVATYELPSTDYVGAFVQKQGNITDVKAYINNELMDSELENNEYMFTKQLTTASPITLRIEAERENTANSGDRISRVLGGFN